MKLLLFSDLHVSRRHCERICQLSTKADILVGAGDFGAVRTGIRKTISWLSEIEKPAVLVPGNAESYEELVQACTQWATAQVLHGTDTNINGKTFYGVGGGIPITPFGSWSYDFSEKQSLELLQNCPEACILVTHSPPYQLLDRSSKGQHLGSTSIRATIDQKTPLLVVCGHIHESGGKTIKYQNTVIVNAGPNGIVYEIS